MAKQPTGPGFTINVDENGAGGLKATLANFDVDDSVLKAGHTAFLDARIVPLLRADGSKGLSAAGKASDSAPEARNSALPARRAQAVLDYVNAKGISASRLSIADDTRVSGHDAGARAVDLLLMNAYMMALPGTTGGDATAGKTQTRGSGMGNEKLGCYETARATVCAEGVNSLYPPHPRPLRLWTAGVGVPLRFSDNDPRLDKAGEGDTLVGQDGWDVAFDFASLAHLASEIDGGFSVPSHACGNLIFDCGPIDDNQITRLVINAHGGPGVVDTDNIVGKDIDSSVDFLKNDRILSAGTVSQKKADLDKILKKLAWRATVFFMCCLTGEGTEGEDFLKAISMAWATKEITVVGYRAILYCGLQSKRGSSGANCYPGCRETHYSNQRTGKDPRDYELPGQWNDLRLLPWATSTTPHARVALKGVITQPGVAAIFDGSCAGKH
jgi:hypothetical protein